MTPKQHPERDAERGESKPTANDPVVLLRAGCVRGLLRHFGRRENMLECAFVMQEEQYKKEHGYDDDWSISNTLTPRAVRARTPTSGSIASRIVMTRADGVSRSHTLMKMVGPPSPASNSICVRMNTMIAAISSAPAFSV
jgi:hypothetical protein